MQQKTKKGKPRIVNLAIMGIASFALYAVLFSEQNVINAYCARGGMFAFLPILTAFIFSFVHGSFTGSFWSFLGMHPKQNQEDHEHA